LTEPIREEGLVLIPRHWSKVTGSADDPNGKRYALRIWGWSADGVAEAATLARRRLADACARVASGALRDEAYFYGKAPLREEIVRNVSGDAIVTRNRYGALVLNTARAPFIDVDTPASRSGSSGGFLGLFGGKQVDAASAALDRVRAACGRFPRTSFRIYRTAAGFRLLATDLLLDPASAQAQELLADFSADPFFVKLCKLQASFRARLTPKPWRCGCGLPPGSFPREGSTQIAFAKWLQEYERAIRSRATCQLVETQGPGRTLPEVSEIVSEHDRACRVGETAPLA
jgi:hypothetical protein